jgi:hypothetical protein
MALRLTQSLTEMSTRNNYWAVKVAGAYGSQPYHLHVPIVLKSGSINLLVPSGPVQDCNGLALALHKCFIQVQLDVHYILYFFLVSSTCFGCYLHPSSGAQL